MQLTPVKPKGFDPFADVDDDKPYGVAGPPSGEPSPSGDDPYASRRVRASPGSPRAARKRKKRN